METLNWVVTGCLSACAVPSLVLASGSVLPDAQMRILVRNSSLRFLQPRVFSELPNCSWQLDTFDGECQPPGAEASHHLELGNTDLTVVSPCSLDFLIRISNDDCSSPSLLSMQLSDSPILISPSVPPGGIDSVGYNTAIRRLRDRKNVEVMEPEPIQSAYFGNQSGHGLSDPSKLVKAMVEKLV